MKKWLLGFVLILIVCTAWYFLQQNNHKPVSLDDVESVKLWQEIKGERVLSKEEQTRIVQAFNSATFERANDEMYGTTPMCGGRIELKSGNYISLIGCGDVFEVQRNDLNTGKTVAYFANAPGFSQLFKKWIDTSK